MAFKAFIALFMGLVIQLSQVRVPVATESVKSCGNGDTMSCCAGRDSCPCAKESNSEQKPAPLVPTSVDLKLLVSKTSGTGIIGISVSPPTEMVFFNTCRLEPKSGYAGVPLSVAFCSFVI